MYFTLKFKYFKKNNKSLHNQCLKCDRREGGNLTLFQTLIFFKFKNCIVLNTATRKRWVYTFNFSQQLTLNIILIVNVTLVALLWYLFVASFWYYSGRRLIGSLWDLDNLIPLTEWYHWTTCTLVLIPNRPWRYLKEWSH